MTRSEREYLLAKRIVQHNVIVKKKMTVNHFLQERTSRPTIY